MDIKSEFYQSILSPEIEYFWQLVALTSCDSSVQVHNDFCWWKLLVEMKTEWQWDPGIVAPSHVVMQVKNWPKVIYFEMSRVQAMKPNLMGFIYCWGELFKVDISLWRNTSVSAELRQPYLTVKLCHSCHQQLPHAINQLIPNS